MTETSRILIIRPSAMGDIVMASGMARILRQASPQARICWLVEPGLADLLRTHPDIDEIIVWPKGEWRRLWRERRWLQLLRAVASLRRELRQRRFDLVLDAVGLTKSRALLGLAGGKRTIGFASKEPGSFLLDSVVPKPQGETRMGAEYAAMMVALGLVADDYAPVLAVAAKDAESARRTVAGLGISGGYAVVAPFTTRPQKHWFAASWQELCRRIVAELQLPVVILGGPAERSAGEELAAAAGPGVYSLCGATTLGETTALIEKTALLVGVDTGLTHMGTAFRRPTVALFGATRPYLTTVSPVTRVLYQPLPCSPCRRTPTCDGAFTCMRAHTPESVLSACRDLLEADR